MSCEPLESQRRSGFACHGDVVRVLTTDDLSKRLESPTGFDRPNPTRTVPLKQRLQLVELSRDRKSCHRSRHVDRRYFKVRELVAAGQIEVEHIDTTDNASDILTKALNALSYVRHRIRALNLRTTLPAESGREGGVGAPRSEGGPSGAE